jgi:branched-chain amino acid transport system permease protein
MQQFFQALVSGLGTAAIYALLGLGFSFIYASTKVVNFAQGDWAMISGMSMSAAATSGLGVIGAAILAPLTGAAVGATGYFLYIRWLRSADVLTRALALLAMSFMLVGLAGYIWGPDAHGIPRISTLKPVRIGGVIITWATIISVVVMLVLFVLITLFLNSTRVGRTMVASSANPEAAALCGIDVRSIVLLSFVLSGTLAGVAGFLVAPITALNFQSGLTLTVTGFAAAALGGLRRPSGAVAGGLLFGMLQQMTATYINGNSSYVITLFVSLVVLLFWAVKSQPRQFRPEQEAEEADTGVSRDVANV